MLHQPRQIGFIERFDPRGQRRVAQNKNRRTVFARDLRCLDRDVKTIFHCRWRKHHAWTVAVATEDRLMQITLLDVGRQTRARAAALNVANDQRDLSHRRPANRFGLERNARARASSYGEITRKGTTKGDRNRSQLILGLNKNAPVLRQLAPQHFHDGRPWRDGITGAVTDACGDESTSQRRVAVHRDLGASAGSRNVLEAIMFRQNVADRIRIAGLERHQRGVDHALVFAAEFFGNDSLEFLDIEKLKRIITEKFGGKNESVVNTALVAFQAGYAYP